MQKKKKKNSGEWYCDLGLPSWLSGKESACQSRSHGSGRSPGGGNGNPLQYSCLGNPMERGTWQATVLGVARVRHDLAPKQQHCDLSE